MTDMNAFERQVSSEISGFMGPVRPVDDAAIFAAITTVPSRKWGILPRAGLVRPFESGTMSAAHAAATTHEWRFQSVFSATKYVVAGAIVALFGGFLLMGLASRPNEDMAPAASASSAPATAEPTATAELLPGVDLSTNEVTPGVFRVLGDGIRDLKQGVSGVASDVEGGVWVLTGGAGDWKVERLGEPGVVVRPNGKRVSLITTFDETPMISAGSRYLSLEDGSWVDAVAEDQWCPENGVLLGEVLMPDGACWRWGLEFRREGGQWQPVSPEDLGLSGDRIVDRLVVGPDGTGWASVRVASSANTADGAAFDGLLSYDGETWTRIPFSLSGIPEDAVGETDDFVVAPDGAIWIVEHYLAAEVYDKYWARRWDGATWTSYGPIDIPGWQMAASVEPDLRTAHFNPDGTAWFQGGGLYFDGTSFHTVERCWGTSDPERCGKFHSTKSASIDPAGNAWYATRDGHLYVITPEAVTGTE